jgi:sugar phosphate isomerase/epimerase
MRFRIACHLCGWPKEVMSDRLKVMKIVRDAGYDGVEGFGVKTADELVEVAAMAAAHGLRLVNAGGPDPKTAAKFNATLGNDAAEVPAQWKGAQELDDAALKAKLDTLRPAIADYAAFGLKPFHHIHVGCILETPDDCARVLKALPDLWLLFDTGHLLAANANPMDVLARWPKQIGHVHLKSFWTQDPKAGWDRHKPDFWKTSRFCDLAEGNTGLDVGAVLDGVAKAGYAGWIAVEEDHPRRDIAAVARDNREFLRKLGH